MRHHYIERESGRVHGERLLGDRCLRFLYSTAREHAPTLFRALTSPRASHLLGWLQFDLDLQRRVRGHRRLARALGVELAECVQPPEHFRTARRVFERQIRYWECRPLPAAPEAVVSPADARVLLGSLGGGVWAKDKFFALDELFGRERPAWQRAFGGGACALFRLTPERYHYTHVPVDGRVVDSYLVDGDCHACNPSAVVAMAAPHSKNRRWVTVVDTDVAGGTGAGLVAMIEVVALMVGRLEPAYSEERYAEPRAVAPGMWVRKGAPKSLFRPGSSTVILLVQKGRVLFDSDLLRNQCVSGVESRFSHGFGVPLVETDVRVRSSIGRAVPRSSPEEEACLT